MKAWDERTLIEDALASAFDDWLHVSDLVGIAQRTGLSSPESLRALALGLLTQLLCSGLLLAGNADELGFHPWDSSPGDALSRIVETWSEDELWPTPGAVAWFGLTPRAEAIARSVLAREKS